MKLCCTLKTLHFYALGLKPNVHIQRRSMIKEHVNLHLTGNVTIGTKFKVERYANLVAYHNAELIIGNKVFVGSFAQIVAKEKIEIGDNVMIADFVVIRDHNHRFDIPGIPFNKQGMVHDPIKIGNNVWIGTKATILAGVTIGDNCVIGANAVVTKDIPSNSVVAGVPARFIKSIYGQTRVKRKIRLPGFDAISGAGDGI